MVYMLLLAITTVPVFLVEGNYLKLDQNKKEKYLKDTLMTAFVLLFLVAILRSGYLSHDVANYKHYFFTGEYQKIEIGYVLLSSLIKNLNLNFRVLIIVIQGLSSIPIFYFIYKKSDLKWLSILIYQALYLYVNSFNVLRQTISMSIILVVYFLLQDKKEAMNRKSELIKVSLSILLILFASLFHASSLFFLFLVPLRYLNLKNKYTNGIILSISVLLFIFHNKIINFILILFNRTYLIGTQLEFGKTTVIILLYLIFIVIYSIKKCESKIQINDYYIKVLLIALLFNLLWIWIPNHARITQYFHLFLVFIIPTLYIKLKQSKFDLLLKFGIVVLVLGMYTLALFYSDYAGIEPYVPCENKCIITEGAL